MKILLCALLMAFSVCVADMCDTTHVGIFKAIELLNNIDSLNINQKRLEKRFEKSMDSLDDIAHKAFLESQKFYSDAFRDLLVVLGIFATLGAGLFVFFNFRQEKFLASSLKEDMKKYELELNKIRKRLISYSGDMFRILARDNLRQAETELEHPELQTHYSKLRSYFQIFIENKIELTEEDTKDFEKIGSFMDRYKDQNIYEELYKDNNSDFWKFLRMLKKFKECYESSKCIEKINEVYDKLYKKLCKHSSEKVVNDKINDVKWDPSLEDIW